jgi:hypothetical protein
MFSVLFCFEKISWNKTKPNDVSETFRIYVSTLASRKGGWCGFRLTFPVRVSMGVSLAMDLCFQDHVELSQGPNNSGFAASVEQEVRQADLLDGMDDRSYSYAPSLAQTDFSEFLPLQTRDDELQLSTSYSTDAIVGSAWTSLQSESPKLPWEMDFWNKFLDPTITALDLFDKGYNKRPMPFHYEGGSASSTEAEVERRVAAKTFPVMRSFLKNIRDVPEKSWQEERDALWETAIRRWVALLDTCNAGDALLIRALQEKASFTEKAQILVDVFFNKAPQTLMKRVNSLSKLCSNLADNDLKFLAVKMNFTRF